MLSEIAIKVENLSKCYHIYDKPRDRLKQMILPRLHRAFGMQAKKYFREFWAIKGVNFEVKKGETIGIVGRNGSGKSTLLQLMCGTLNPTNGSAQTNGRVAALLELGSGFNPEFTGRENVYLNGAILGLTQNEVEEKFAEITAFADIGDFIDQPVKTYSSGMFVRLAFAIQANVNPEILIVDEALAVGDVFFVHKCMSKFHELKRNGTTIIFVSHDVTAVKTLCEKAIWIKDGVLYRSGKAASVVDEYLADDYDFTQRGSDVAIVTAQNVKKEILENKFRPLTPIKRYCGGILEFESGALLDKDGAEIGQVYPEELIALEVKLKNNSLQYKTKLIVGYVLRNIRGVDISSNNNEVEGYDLRSPNKNGELTIRIEFKIPTLHPGPYAISISVSFRDQIGSICGLDLMEDVFRFELLEKKKCHVLMTFDSKYSTVGQQSPIFFDGNRYQS